MAISFQNRRNGILAECHQLKQDVDSYNENDNPGEQIEIIYDFTIDLKDLESCNSGYSAA